MKNGKPNMHDVAKLAGVSIATVSYAINGTRYVSKKSKMEIDRAIKELGYTPDLFARGMRMGKKNIIGFIVPDISNSYFATIIEKVEECISESGYFLIIFNTKETQENEIQRLNYLTSGTVDGLLLASTIDDYSKIESLIPKNFPVVLVDRTLKDSSFDSVNISSTDALTAGVKDLIASGHKNIGFIAGLERLNTTTERLNAYKQALEESHIPIRGDLIQYGNSMAGSAVECARSLYYEKKCDSIVVSNGVMSMETISFFLEQGVTIGEDIDLLIFNDSPIFPYSSLGKIRIVNQPVEELGIHAGKMILDRIKDVTAPTMTLSLSCSYKSRP